MTGLLAIIFSYNGRDWLIEANYSNGDYYHYTYDAVGNRLSQTTQEGTINYTYDDANRLISVTGTAGTTTYAYDGLGNRYQQTAGGVTTTYTLDIAAGLTQVLSDGTNEYLLDRSKHGALDAGGNPMIFSLRPK